MLSPKMFDFVSSFGMMLLGVALLFVFSVSFSPSGKNLLSLPTSNNRVWNTAANNVSKELPRSRPLRPLPKDSSEYSGELTAISALVVDDFTNTNLFGKNNEEKRPLASISKLMSALVLMDLPMDWNTTTAITEDDLKGGDHFVGAGENFKANDLWNIALIGSSNTAINALVRLSGLTPEQFVAQMNQKAVDLKLKSMQFFDPTGLDARNQANAKDISLLLKEALKKEKILKTLQLGEYDCKPLNKEKMRPVYSTNLLLTKWVPNDFKKSCIAGKTGYINDSLYNFVVRLNNGEKTVRVVVLGASTGEARFTEARDLAEWAFQHYLWPGEEGYEKLVK